jgi:autotransporter-associated beta strand protein
VVNNGELRIRNTSNRLPITTDVIVNSPGIFNVNGVVASPGGQQIGSLAGNGPVGLGNSTLIIAGANSTTYSGVIQEIANAGAGGYSGTGHGSLTKDGSSALTLTGLNTYQATFTLSNGVVNVSPGASLCGAICDVVIRAGALNLSNNIQTIENLTGTGGTISLSPGTTLLVSDVSGTTCSSAITGAGGITKTNNSTSQITLTLSGANTYDGNTIIQPSGGKIQVASPTALGSAVGYTDVGSGGEVLFDGVATTFTCAEPIRISGIGAGDGGAITIQNGSSPTLSGPITLTGDATITVSSSSSGTFSNPNSFTSLANQNLTIAGGLGTAPGGTISGAINLNGGGLTKTNTGTWNLTGASTYSGPTRIVGGTLRVNGSITGSAVSATNGTLAGTGTIAGSVTTLAGTAPGIIAPGNSGIGTLNVNGPVILGGSAVMEINRSLVPNSDNVSCGTVAYGGTLSVVNIGPAPVAGDTFALFSAGSYSGSFSGITLPSLTPGLVWDTSQLSVSGKIRVMQSIVLTCSSNITVSATSPAGAVVTYTSSATGGCTPPTVSCTPPSGSLFPLGTTIVSCTATDTCGQVTNCSFQITVNSTPAGQEYFEKDNPLPPTNTAYISPDQWHVLFANGIVIKDISHDQFTASHPPPGPSNTIVHVFNSVVGFDLSTDNGATYSHVTAPANVQVQVTHTYDANGIEHYDTEMQQLDISGGSLPGGVMVRESPTLQSLGQTTIRPVAGGYLIASFFDVNVEVSADGGSTWTPGNAPAHVEMRNDPNTAPEVAEPNLLLPPPQDLYVSPEQWHALFAQGIVIKDVSHDRFTQALVPPTTGSNTEAFNSHLSLKISTDGGVTFQQVDASAPVNISVSAVGSPTSGRIDTEMTSLSLSGLPGGIMVRESPSLPSRGGTRYAQQPDGTYKIHSFFDIFTEVSTDGGASWNGATNGPVRMELVKRAAETPQPTDNLPPAGTYVSPADWHAYYAMGIVISNVSHARFTQTQPPPPTGGTNNETFNSQVSGLISQDGGLTFNSFAAPAAVSVTVISRPGLSSGPTRTFDTEMTQLDISGGTLPGGVMVRESPSKASLGRTSVRLDPATGQYYIASFFDVFTEISLDGGATWSAATNPPSEMTLVTNGPPPPPFSISCPSNFTVVATSPAGAVVTYTATTSGGCPPITVVGSPPSGSTFPIGTTNVTVTASDGCGQVAQCSFTVTVLPPAPDCFTPNYLLPPPNTVYISPALWHVLYNNGIVIRDIRHRFFTDHLPPPPLGGSQLHAFSSEVDYDVSFDNGATFTPGSGTANVQVKVTHSSDDSTGQHYDTEMLQLDLTGPGFMLRESPTLQSKGQTTIRPVAGGYMVSSFFDVFTEVSTDGGSTWTAAQAAGHVELRNDPLTVPSVGHPTPRLPPPTGVYISPQQWHALYAQGIVIRDVRHKVFTQSYLPPPTGSNDIHTLNSQLDMQISLDGGASYQYVRVPATMTVSIGGVGSGANMLYDTEMLSLTPVGLPSGIMVRESPTLPSRGGTQIDAAPDGSFRIHSFFDVFTEVSTDGGATWSGATNGPVRMELTENAPEVPKPNPNLPPLDGTYVSPAQWHALYANGIIITNASHDKFNQTQPPPPPGGSQTENFGSTVHGLISMDGGASFQPFSAPASVAVQVNSRSDEDTGPTRFFDTEMLALSLSGGNLPGGVMVRESPTKASLGRTSIRGTSTGYQVSSFFDVFTEVSLDGGATWSPGITHPGTMGLQTNGPPPPPLSVTCPSNITVYATSPAGAVVTYTATPSGGCPPINVVGNPPSGSVFPIATTPVTVMATDSCGQSAQCTFTVTVLPPIPEYFEPNPLLPPPGTVYISPALWHVLYNNGIIIRDIRHRAFTDHLPPPPLGTTQMHVFSSELDYDISFDNGATFTPGSGTANVQVKVTHSSDNGGKSFYDTEMLQLDLTGPGFMLRESPTLQSTGQTTIRPVAGGYMVSSFFDVFTEISTDGGATWTPAQGAGHVELRNDPETASPASHPTDLLPPPVGEYVSPQLWHALFAQGIVIKDVSHKFFTDSQPPPPTGSNVTHSFNSTLDMSVSIDGGASFQFARVSAPVTVALTAQGSSSSGFYDTEMLQLDVGGGLPSGIMIRESPSLPSRGGTIARLNGLPPGDPDFGTFRIGSFFDIFVEVSTDGGATWSGATNGPVRMQLKPAVTEVPKPTPNLPPLDGNYVSPAKWHALYANGIIITNASHDRFTQNQPPPPPGGNQTENFGSQVHGSISMDGGASFQLFSAPASVAVQVNSSQDSGSTRYFNTEMLALNLSGGNLPGGVMVRESPTKASLGRTSVRQDSGGQYHISSFFDVFTEVSLDGGATWSPSTTAPGPMGLSSSNPPVVLTCSSNITVTAAICSNCAVVSFNSFATGGCSGAPTVICTPPSGTCFPIGVTTVTCTAFDCGVVATNCSFTVTVLPYVCPPLVVTCSSNITVTASNCASGGPGAVVFFNSSVTGGCTNPTIICNPPSGSTFPVGTTTVTCTGSDGCGNTTNCSFTVTVAPCAPIVLTCSSNIVVNSTNCGSAGTTVFFTSSATGGCGPTIVNCNPPSGSTFPIGTTIVTCIATDSCGNKTNCSFNVTVNPCPPVVLTCSSNIVVSATNCGTGAGANVFYTSSVSGGCGPATVSCNPPSGSFFPIGTTLVTCTAFDCGVVVTNCSFTVTVTPPSCPPIVLTCSSNILVNSTSCGNTGAVVFYNSSATGGCGPTTVSCNPPSGSAFPIGTTIVTCIATDSCGNKTNCSFNVTVNPCPPVVLTCSSNIVVNATNCGTGAGANVFYTSSVSGGCGPATVSCNPPSGSFFPIGTTTVTCTAFDCGVVVTNCSFTVTVNPPGCPPIVLTCSSNIVATATNCGSGAGATVFYTSSATGGCAPTLVTCNPPSGSTFPLGITTVTCIATDSCGNKTNCSFTVTVNPCAPVVLTCSSNIVVNTTNCSATGATVFFTSSVTGGCGPATLSCNPPSGSFFPLGTTTVTCSAFDCGVVVTNCSFTITVKPPTCPAIVVNCSSNIFVQTPGCIASNATVFYSSSATGGCPPLTLTCNPPSGSSFPPGITTVFCTATDSCGHSNVCSFTVTVTNGGVCPPIVLACSSNLTITANSCTGSVPVFFTSSATGGCGTTTVLCSPPSGSSFPVNVSTLVTCTATDSCGHSTNCSFAITVNPPQCPPIVLTCSSNITITANSCTGSVPVFFSSSATGGCGPVTVTCSPPSGSSFPVNASTLVTCTATDSCGHSTNCSFAITVNPPHCPPIVLNCPKKIKVVTHNHFGAFVFWTSTASGGCPPTTVTCNPPSGSFFPIGTTLVTCTACDSCGHCTNCSFFVTVIGQHFVATNLLPVTNTVYISPATWHALYANGVVIRDVRHRFFTTGTLPPPLGTTQIHTFDSQLDFELSTDNGNTFQGVSAPATTTVSVTHSSDAEGIESYDTEMLSLDAQGLPNGIRLRESPTLQSLGQTSIEPTPGGYMVSSFFDVFTEISLDNGVTWTAADDSGSVEMRNDPRAVSPGTVPGQLLPPPNGAYVSPQQWHALYAQGIVIKDVRHKFFTQSLQPPPPAGSNTESFNSTLDMQVSTDGGQTFSYVRAAAPVTVTISSVGSGNSGMYETEMTQLDLTVQAGGQTLKIRESPTLPSRGGTQIDSQPDGTFRVNSFFDIFTEISLDGGNTWSAASNGPVRMEFSPQTIELPSSTPNLPPTNAPYISPAQWHALYQNGIIITNVSHSKFLQTQPPPQPGQSVLETFNSTVDGQVSTDGGKTFTPFSATASAAVQVISRADQDAGSTRFFDTEMLSLDVQGLPNGMRLRESPTKASLGRTSIRTTPDGYRIGSFFDIFTEISTDGGATWSPSTTVPATMTPRLPARKRYFPQPYLPPTNGQYISPKQWHALYANGVIVSNVTHRRFLDNFPPPPKNTTNSHNFNSQVNFLLKMPGQPFVPMTANANCTVSVGSSGFQSKEQVYQTEMVALNLSGGSLPPGVMIRESPSKRSLGETHYSGGGGGGGGYRISSFFDIFTEVSLDGGNTWSPAGSAGTMELHIDPGVPPTTIVKPRINAGTPTFTVQSQLGLQYLLQYKNDLLDATWTTISMTKGNGDDLDLIDCCPPPGPSRPHRFYQVEVQEDDTY